MQNFMQPSKSRKRAAFSGKAIGSRRVSADRSVITDSNNAVSCTVRAIGPWTA